MEIKNIDASGDPDCKCESWLDHWERFSGQTPTFCPVQDCMNPIELGARVRKEASADSGWYVVPLCLKHGAKTGESFRVNDHVEWVTLDAKETCG